MQSPLRVFMMLSLLLAWPVWALAQATPGYTMHQITYPGSIQTWVFGLNDRKNVIGIYMGTDGWHYAYTKYGSAYLPFEPPDGNCGLPADLNTFRHIIGLDCSGSYLKIGAAVTDIAVPQASQTIVRGLNDSNVMVGGYYLAGDTITEYPFVLTASGYADLPPSPIPGAQMWAEDVNNHGHIVGTLLVPETWTFYGFVLIDGEYTVFTLPGNPMFSAVGLNDHGHLVGSYYDAPTDRWRGFLRKNGVFTTINVTKDAATSVSDINNHGHIAGVFQRPYDEWLVHGFLAVPKPPKASSSLVSHR
jgi:hypothetical protein